MNTLLFQCRTYFPFDLEKCSENVFLNKLKSSKKYCSGLYQAKQKISFISQETKKVRHDCITHKCLYMKTKTLQ